LGPPVPPTSDLLHLLGQLAALPVEQRAIVRRLLNPKDSPTAPASLDDTLSRGFERPKVETS
jgi:hypothetical protein